MNLDLALWNKSAPSPLNTQDQNEESWHRGPAGAVPVTRAPPPAMGGRPRRQQQQPEPSRQGYTHGPAAAAQRPWGRPSSEPARSPWEGGRRPTRGRPDPWDAPSRQSLQDGQYRHPSASSAARASAHLEPHAVPVFGSRARWGPDARTPAPGAGARPGQRHAGDDGQGPAASPTSGLGGAASLRVPGFPGRASQSGLAAEGGGAAAPLEEVARFLSAGNAWKQQPGTIWAVMEVVSGCGSCADLAATWGRGWGGAVGRRGSRTLHAAGHAVWLRRREPPTSV